MHSCMCRGQGKICCVSLCHFQLYSSYSLTKPEARLLPIKWPSCLCPIAVIGLEGHMSTSGFIYGFWGFELRSSCLYSKPVNTSPVLSLVFTLPFCRACVSMVAWPWDVSGYLWLLYTGWYTDICQIYVLPEYTSIYLYLQSKWSQNVEESYSHMPVTALLITVKTSLIS